MKRKIVRRIKQITLALGTGFVFGTLTCVQNVADTLGTGLSVTGATGILGGNSQAAINIGVGLDLLADLIRLAPGG